MVALAYDARQFTETVMTCTTTFDTLRDFLGPDRHRFAMKQLVNALKDTGREGLNIPEAIQRSSLQMPEFVGALGLASKEGIVESFADRNIQRLRLSSF